MTGFAHAMPFGAQGQADGTVHFRLWAPDAAAVRLELDDGRSLPMRASDDGWHEARARAASGTGYRFRLPDGLVVPDPASRSQREGDVHGWSVVTDPAGYAWRQPAWSGRPWHESVIYEVHAGTCGGFRGVQAMLPRLRALGITLLELMPVAQFPGSRNWGYDGVLPFAPAAAYGTPDELKALVDAAHALDMGVMLDVVYNHFGPDGNYLGAYASAFFHEADTPWGSAVAVDRPVVGDFFVHNALYWLEEFRFDGLRLDAVHAIGNADWLRRFAARVRSALPPGRHVHLVLENEANQASLLGEGRFDAQWNDDFHNALHVLLTGETAGYYGAYADDPLRHLVRCLAEGFAWQGEPMRGKPRGESSADLPPVRFVQFAQNHDQVGNRALGERLDRLVDARVLEAVYALLLLCPAVPLLFMGEEWASRRPFLFFTDHQDPALRSAVRDGRRSEFAEFEEFAAADVPDPNALATFERSRLQPADGESAAAIARERLLRDLLAQRREHVWPGLARCRPLGARALGKAALAARWKLDDAVLWVFANLGDREVTVDAVPTPDARWLHGRAQAIARLAGGELLPACTLVCLESQHA